MDGGLHPGENLVAFGEDTMDTRVLVGAAALGLVALAGVGGWALMQSQTTPPPTPPVAAPVPTAPPRTKADIRAGKQPDVTVGQPPAGQEQVVVKYAEGVTDERISAFEAQHGLKLAKEIPAIKAKVYDVPAGHGTTEVIGWFTSEAGLVAYAERNGSMQMK